MSVSTPESRSPRQRRDDLLRSVYFLRAKAFCRGYSLSCFLDEQPSDLVPRPARDDVAARDPDGDLVVNSSFRFEPGGASPPELLHRLPPLDGLLRGFPLAWIEDPGTGIWAPFWARGEWVDVLRSLHAGRRAPSGLRPNVRHALAVAHVLVPPDYEQGRRATWEGIRRDAGAQFKTHGYAIVRNLIHPVHIAAMRRYYRALVASGRLPVGDKQVAERHRLNSEPVGMFFHPQLVDLVSRIAGEPVKPSYVYFASYPPGSALPRHVDREQCEFSISLLVDYSPEPEGPCGWPLFLEDSDQPENRAAADLGVGDVVFYRGRQLVHYRDRLPDGHRSSSLFFHYLPRDHVGNSFLPDWPSASGVP